MVGRPPFAPPFLTLCLLSAIAPRAGFAQTVIHDSAPTPRQPAGQAGGPSRATIDSLRAMLDSLRARGDTSRTPGAVRPAAALAPAPGPAQAQAVPKPAAPAGPPLPPGVCPPGSDPVSAEVLLVVFRARTTQAERDATIKAVKGTIVAADPTDPASAYVHFPTDGNEFALRVAADRLIRASTVKEVDAVECPATQ